LARQAETNKYCLRQVADLKSKYPGSKTSWKRGIVRWIGDITPAPLCDTYTVQITWKGWSARPVVRVLRPQLQLAEGKTALPHIYPGDELCLHYPGEWTRDMSIAETIIPWASEWLYFYELWALTGEWQGGGHEPGTDDAKGGPESTDTGSPRSGRPGSEFSPTGRGLRR
jgi:hypothetical protein